MHVKSEKKTELKLRSVSLHHKIKKKICRKMFIFNCGLRVFFYNKINLVILYL